MSRPYASRNDVTVMREGGRWRLVTQKGVPFGPSYTRQSDAVARCKEVNRLRDYARRAGGSTGLLARMRRSMGI